MYPSTMRALVVVRLSSLSDESTSPERQRAVCQRFCDDRGWEVIDTAEDLDVSASTSSPFERPALKPWLERPGEYDVIVVWRLDRLVRKVSHLARMIEWSEQHDVNLVSATEPFDLSTPLGRALVYLIGVFAEMEATAISERNTQAAAHNIRAGKYRGGTPPLGYRPVEVGGGWRFQPDPETLPLLREVIDRILAGDRPGTVCRDLNARGELTSADRHRVRQGNEPLGARWQSMNLTREITSPTMLGQVVSRPFTGKRTDKGRKVYGEPAVVRGDDGAPIVRAAPLIDRERFERLCAAVGATKGKHTPYGGHQALLLGVISCAECGSPYWLGKGRSHKYYRCGAQQQRGESCGSRAVRQDIADEFVTEHLIADFGDVERMRRVYEPAEDHAAELADVNAELIDVAGLIGTGPFRSGPARLRLEQRAEALDRRREVLEATPSRAAGYRLEPTGQTFGRYWEELDDTERGQFLQDHRVRLEYRHLRGEGPDFHLVWSDLETLRNAAVSG